MKPLPRVSVAKYAGLGDVVHTLAQPVAKLIDAVAGTDIQHCSACGQRRKDLNAKVPFTPSNPAPSLSAPASAEPARYQRQGDP